MTKKIEEYLTEAYKDNIICPVCGEKLVAVDQPSLITSAHERVACQYCDYHGHRIE